MPCTYLGKKEITPYMYENGNIKMTLDIKWQKGYRKKEPYHTVGGKVNWYSHYKKPSGLTLKKVEMEILYLQAILLVGIYPKNMKPSAQNPICSSVFIVALCTIVWTRKQLKCSLVDDQIRKMWHSHMVKYYVAIRKNEMLLFQQKGREFERLRCSKVNQNNVNKQVQVHNRLFANVNHFKTSGCS